MFHRAPWSVDRDRSSTPAGVLHLSRRVSDSGKKPMSMQHSDWTADLGLWKPFRGLFRLPVFQP
jgi:hypothetical protein